MKTLKNINFKQKIKGKIFKFLGNETAFPNIAYESYFSLLGGKQSCFQLSTQVNSSEVRARHYSQRKVNLNNTFYINLSTTIFRKQTRSTVFNPKEMQHENSVDTLETKPIGYSYNPCLLESEQHFLQVLECCIKNAVN